MSHPPPIRVMIVEDSPVVRLLLESIVTANPRLELAASVASGEAALHEIPRCRPDVISMDISLPGIDGLETTRRIMQEYPTPIVVVSAHLNHDELNLGFNAVKAGALCVIDKPPGPSHPQHQHLAQQLCTQLLIMSQVKVIRLRSRPQAAPRLAAEPGPAAQTGQQLPYEMLAIVASTGGPRALATLLNALGADFPLPILLVQHITASFFEGFVDWLNGISPLPAQAARDGERPQAGRIYLAPSDHHLLLARGRLLLQNSDPVSYQRPSGTVLLRSLAKELGPRGIGVVLTGMGDDGAEGLLQMRKAGGYTLAESEATAAVYGMPAVAARLQAARHLLPIFEMGPHLRQLLFKEP